MLRRYIIKRVLIAIPTLVVISFAVFMIIQLPPGSFVEWQIQQMEESGQVDMVKIQQLVNRYQLDEPLYVQYFAWFGSFLTGDMGESFQTGVPVSRMLADLLPATIAISVFSLLLTWAIAVPFGVLAAVERNTFIDYLLTLVALTAMATPAFVLALLFMMGMQALDPSFDPTGLFSPEYANAPWSWAKVADLLMHLWVPVVILGVRGTAGMIRILRANVIDELRKQYVQAARARGLHPALVVLRYPVRVAVNPLISNIGLVLPRIISGSVIIAFVLGLQTVGPQLLQALRAQDTYLATSIVFFQCILAVVGILISDILLAVVDPRIRFGG